MWGRPQILSAGRHDDLHTGGGDKEILFDISIERSRFRETHPPCVVIGPRIDRTRDTRGVGVGVIESGAARRSEPRAWSDRSVRRENCNHHRADALIGFSRKNEREGVPASGDEAAGRDEFDQVAFADAEVGEPNRRVRAPDLPIARAQATERTGHPRRSFVASGTEKALIHAHRERRRLRVDRHRSEDQQDREEARE